MKYVVIFEKPPIIAIKQQITLLVCERSDRALNTIFACERYRVFDKASEAIEYMNEQIE